jgi:3-oxoacyl-[acyl-carrier protein] reductase
VINYRDRAAEADAVKQAIESAGGHALAVQADVAERDQVMRMFDQAGDVDILVNNAGVLRKGDLADFDFSQMDGMRRVNVDGLVHCTRAAVDRMKQRGFGRIVNITSIAAFGTAFTGTTFYAATKAAVVTLTRRFAMELGPFGITVNAIAPGLVITDMTSGASQQNVVEKTMVRRVGQPDDIANAVAFLTARESSFITAQVLCVDGGRMDFIAHP